MQQKYLSNKSPLVTSECNVCLFDNGTPVDLIEIDNCNPLHTLYNPRLPNCVEDIPLTLTEQKLCELVEQDTDTINAFDGSITLLGKCTPEGLPILVCKITNEETGEPIFQNHAPTGENGTLEPYAGECVECNKQYNPVELWVSDPTSAFCDYRVYECDGDKYIFNPSTCEYEIIPMGIQTTPYQPSGELVCREAQFAAFELVPGATDVATIVAAVLAANPLDFDVNGTLIPVTADDVNYIKVTPKACGTFDSADNEILVDFINVNGSAASNFLDVEDGGVDAATTIEVPATGCALVDVCFKKCWTKQEVAAL